jgi:hypothetical protein
LSRDKNAPAGTPGYGAPPLPSDLQVFGPRSPMGDKCELVMATVEGGGEVTGGEAVVFVELPSAKVLTRVSIFCAPIAGSVNPMENTTAAILAGTWSLWAALLTETKFGGRAGNFFPTRNVVGTRAAPLNIPTDTGLWGFEFEIQTAAASRLRLLLTEIESGASDDYEIRAQVTYQSIVAMSPQEWGKFIERAGIKGAASFVG